MKITVTRTWEPVTRTIDDCRNCPYYHEEPDGNSNLQVCEHPQFGNGGYDNVIPDITWPWIDATPKISNRCPYLFNK